MEKITAKRKNFRFFGLLIFLLLNGICSFAKALSPSEIRQLTVKADTKEFFTAQENGYSLRIKGITPEKIQTDLPQLPSGVSLVTSKREEVIFEDGERGTLIRLWFSFRDTGDIKLPPLILSVGRRTYYIPFERRTVYENPALITPEVQIDFLKGITIEQTRRNTTYSAVAGQKIEFLLQLKYFVQIVQFEWNLPQDSIFEEKERFEITRGIPQGTDFSSEAVNVARFEWTPLKEGNYSLPEITLIATSYNGSRKKIQLPSYTIKVLPPTNADFALSENYKKSLHGENNFEKAFIEQKTETSKTDKITISKENCRKLAELYSKEKNSFPKSKFYEERKALEDSLSIKNDDKVESKSLIYLSVGFTILLATFTILFFVFAKTLPALIFLVLFTFSMIFSIAGIGRLSEKYAIFAGGEIASVPEISTLSVSTEQGGKKVKILEKAGDYYYIQSKELTGWVFKDSIFEIE